MMKRLTYLLSLALMACALFAQPVTFVDRYQSTLASGYTSGGGSLSVTSASGLPSGTCYFFAIVRAEGVNTEEVFLVTNVSGTTLTVTGAKAGSSASNHGAGATIIAAIMSKDAYTQMEQDVQSVSIANEGSTGTTVNKLAKLTGAPSTAKITATTDTGGAIGIVVAGAGTSGSALVQFSGTATCVFDGATTAGNYVQLSSTTAGDCHDAGSTYPTSGQTVGRVLSTNGGGGSYSMLLFPPESKPGIGGASYGAYASLPATCSTGDIYRTSDSLYTFQCTAANTWTAFYRDYKVVVPPTSSWSWDNQSTATQSASHGYQYFSFPKTGTAAISLYYRTAPSTPYTVKAVFRHDISGAPPGAAPASAAGRYMLAFRDSGGKIIEYGVGLTTSAATAITTFKWTNSTTASAAYVNYTNPGGAYVPDFASRPETHLAITDDGTNLKFWWSIDGFTWNLFDSRGRTDFMGSGPNAIAVGGYPNGTQVEAVLLSWEVTASSTP